MHQQWICNHVILHRETETLRIDILPQRWKGLPSQSIYHGLTAIILSLCGLITFYLVRYGFTAFLAGQRGEGIGAIANAGLFLVLVSIASEAWLVEMTERISLSIDRHHYQITWRCWGLRGRQYVEVRGNTPQIQAVSLCIDPAPFNLQYSQFPYRVFRFFPYLGSEQTVCILREGDRPYLFGVYLSRFEQEHLIQEITTFLSQIRQEALD